MAPKNSRLDTLADGKKIKFTVDAALLSELGERLVGKPYIALGELVKNSYDADATSVTIRFGEDRIEIIDNGYGMDFKEFQGFWMRVGSQHKQQQRYSRNFARPMTGSKGIGRLAVQFLAKEISMRTVSEKNLKSETQFYVNWADAHRAGELTEATAKYKTSKPSTVFPNGSKNGTAIILSGLNQVWDASSITDLAKEIWPLQPPFRSARDGDSQEDTFKVDLDAPDAEAVQRFENQMEAVLKISDAKLNGRLVTDAEGKNCKVKLTLEFKGDEEKISHDYKVNNCNLNFVEFEIRIFNLQGKQSFGIIVDEAREYFKRFGGVHVYDAGFHMPFYGSAEGDWLRIQYDHAARISRSSLLPEELQEPRGLQFLPTLSRTFGVVHVDTARERKAAQERGLEDKADYLQISVTRDRLVNNGTYETLRDIVRYAVDYYATREAARQYAEKALPKLTEPVSKRFERAEDVVERYQEDIPQPVYRTLLREVKDAVASSRAEEERIARQTGLLGALATTGISALAYEHETKKYHFKLYEFAKDLGKIKVKDPSVQSQLDNIVKRLEEIIDQSRALRGIFTAMLDEENRTKVERFKARSLIRDVGDQLGILLHGAHPSTYEVDENLLLPRAAYAEWSAIFQNIFMNSVNAMLDKDVRQIKVSSRIEGNRRTLLIQDTGVGVKLSTSEELFKPFVRKLKLSPEWKGLGLGGTGLGLTIVRMIGDSIGCNISFVKPEDGFKTALQIQWREKS
jgi:signal transduction histidine kinase